MKIYLVGIGMGNAETLTKGAREAIDKADIIIGASRMTELADKDKPVFNAYKAEEIADYIADCVKNNMADCIAVLLSGDVGFYSGAKRLLHFLKEYDVELVAGISSVAYFCARLKTSWEDIKLISMHGKRANAIQYIKRYKKVFMLLNGNDSIKELCQGLCCYGMGDVILNIGQRLSYMDERIVTARARDITSFNFDSLAVVIAENPTPLDLSMSAIADEEFIRGDVPMTKSEVRSLSISKLCLNTDSVLYDIGAGTGSVSVEAGLRLIDGQVYAIEKNPSAVELIEQNKKKFAVDNISVINGYAPSAMEDLPVPTHAFIGGSGGNIADIIDSVLNKNPNAKIVANVIALNTLGELIKVLDERGLSSEIVSVNIARERLAGSYRLMMGQNPVYIITIWQGGKNNAS